MIETVLVVKNDEVDIDYYQVLNVFPLSFPRTNREAHENFSPAQPRHCPYADCADKVLLALVSQNDAGAYAVLYERHARIVFNLQLRITRDAQVAEELLQDTFWQVWQKADQFAGRGTPVAWLMRIARNKALDHLRSRRCHAQVTDHTLEQLDHVAAVAHPTTEQAVEQRWLQQHVVAALNQLPSEQRACVELAYFEGLSQTEIAAYTHLPLGTIKTRLRLGRDKVERVLRAFGYRDSYGPHLT